MSRSIAKWLANPDRGPFRAWVLRIARNAALNALTRPSRRGLGTGDSRVARLLMEHADSSPDLQSEVESEYRREVFGWAADQVRIVVSYETFEAFWRTAVENRAIATVAAELELSVGAVYIARSRVMARLRELVRQFEERGR